MWRLAEGAGWTLGCAAIWLTTQSSVTGDETLVAFAAAVLCALAATGGRALVGGRWTVRPGWLVWLARIPASAVIETAQVLRSAARRQSGRTVSVNLPGREPDEVSDSREGWGTLLLSASPGSYVVDADPDRRRLTVHRLGRGAPRPVRIDPAAG